MNTVNHRESGSSPWSRWLRLAVYGIAAAVLLLYMSGSLHLRGSGQDWFFLVIGIVISASIIFDIRRGVTMLTVGDDYVRSKSPVGFWVSIAIQAVFALGCIVGTLGGIIGLWKF